MDYGRVFRVVPAGGTTIPPAIQPLITSPGDLREFYPDGWVIQQELGSDTGQIKRHRMFFIIDRTVPVGFEQEAATAKWTGLFWSNVSSNKALARYRGLEFLRSQARLRLACCLPLEGQRHVFPHLARGLLGRTSGISIPSAQRVIHFNSFWKLREGTFRLQG